MNAPVSSYRFLLSRRWLLGHLAVLLIVATCVGAGVWQVNRLHDRRERNELIRERTRAAPVPIERLFGAQAPARGSEVAYRRVTARGRYDAEREFVLLGRALDGRPGNHVLTPLVGEDGRILVVDRGWVPFELDRPPLRPAAPPPGTVDVAGVLLAPEPRARFGPRDPAGGERRTLLRADLDRIARALGSPVYPAYLLLRTQRPPPPGRLPVAVSLPPLSEGPHLSYAIQWFSFGAIALVTYGALVRKRRRAE